MSHRDDRRPRWAGAALGALAAGLTAAGFAWPADASESCREWTREHARWKARAVRHYLTGSPQAELDAALFEVLQREAYLTSCEVPVRGGRAEWIGWRLVGRAPEGYGRAALESVLEQGGFELSLRDQLAAVAPPAAPSRAPRRSRPRHATR